MSRLRGRPRGVWGRRALGIACPALALLVAAAPGMRDTSRSHAAPGRAPKRPNILIVITDDQRAGLGQMDALRRNLVRRGTSFVHAFATTPSCCPSRATIFTGRYSHNHGVTNNQGAENLNQFRTVQRKLQDAGYTTAIFGKFLNYWLWRPPYFNRWSTMSGPVAKLYHGGSWSTPSGRHRVDTYSTRYIARRATAFLRGQERRADAKPWLMYVTPHAPHAPYTVEARYRGAPLPKWKANPAVRESDRSDKPPYVRRRRATYDRGVFVRKRQLRTLMSVDDLVQRVMRTLRALGETRNTLVIFTTDNGFLWSDHGIQKKFTPYKGSVGVPLIARWPGHVRAGAVDDRLVGNIDIAPTVLHAAGVTSPSDERLDGESLLDRTWERNRLLLEFTFEPALHIPTWASMVTKDFQYTEYYSEETGQIEFREYYDNEADPWQLHNLYGDADPTNDPLYLDMSSRLRRDRECSGESCP